MSTWINQRRKAIAALVVPIAAFLTANGILDIDPALAALIATIVSGGLVYAVPNSDA